MKITTRIYSVLAALLALTGCSGADVLNAFIPHSGYAIHKDIAYGENPRQQLDIYVPEKLSPSKAVIVFFYGGSWQTGSKDTYRFVGQAFASKGYITVIADYRLYPEIYFPAFMHDGAHAVNWVHEHIGEYGGDPSHIFLAGHSAGAHIAMMLTLNRTYLQEAGANPAWINGTIGLAGPYDFLPFTDPKIIALFSKARDADTQPINFVRPHTPPILLLTGDADDQVGAKNSRNLAAKLREYHDPVEEKIYPGVGHIGMVLSLAAGFRGKAPTLDDTDQFIRTHMPEK